MNPRQPDPQSGALTKLSYSHRRRRTLGLSAVEVKLAVVSNSHFDAFGGERRKVRNPKSEVRSPPRENETQTSSLEPGAAGPSGERTPPACQCGRRVRTIVTPSSWNWRCQEVSGRGFRRAAENHTPEAWLTEMRDFIQFQLRNSDCGLFAPFRRQRQNENCRPRVRRGLCLHGCG